MLQNDLHDSKDSIGITFYWLLLQLQNRKVNGVSPSGIEQGQGCYHLQIKQTNKYCNR